MNQAWPALHLTTAQGANAAFFTHGAHVTRWLSARGRDWLFTSRAAEFAEGKPIRGGVPVVFPQFNLLGSGPKHGFLRHLPWQLEEPPATSDRGASCRLGFTSNATTLALWPHPFAARFTIELNDTQLAMHLNITNTGDSSFSFTSALHTYFAIDDLFSARVSDFEPCQYWDNGTPFNQRHTFNDTELRFTGAIDRVYFNVARPLKLHTGNACLEIAQQGFCDAVIWNPGAEGATAISDFADDEYAQMLCIEAAAIDNPIQLMPGESWQGSQVLTEL